MKSTRKRVLEEIDGVLDTIDGSLRAAQDVRYREAVGRLMESAAQDCGGPHNMDETLPPDGVTHYDWRMSVRRSADIHANRMCPHHANCWDAESGRHLDCNDAYEDVLHDYLDARGYLWEDTGVPWTYCNADVYRDPPDGVDPILDLQIPWVDGPQEGFILFGGRQNGLSISNVQVFTVVIDGLSEAFSEMVDNIVDTLQPREDDDATN